MNIWEADKLILFFAFVIPGFISLKAYELFFPSERTDSGKQIIEALTYSSINYAFLFWFIVDIEKSSIKNTAPFLYFAFYIFVFFLAPIIWVIAWKGLRKSKFFQKNAPHPTHKPWDYVFSQTSKSYWVKVTLKNGTILAGKYSDKSFTSSSPAEEQIYLEETWLLNDKGGFDRPKNQTAGIIILSGEISYIELLTFISGENNEQKD